MNKEIIIAEIKRTAQENGDKPLGSRKFESETGIKSIIWLGKIWARWGDALQEAGFMPNALVESHSKDFLFECYAKLSSENSRLVTKSDMRLISRSGREVPDWNTFQNRFGSKAAFIKELYAYLLETSKYPDILQLCRNYSEGNSKAPVEDDDKVVEPEEISYVYLIKSGKFYKIGRTNSVGRRSYEIAIQMPEEITEIHRILTDDPVGIERYSRFANGSATIYC